MRTKGIGPNNLGVNMKAVVEMKSAAKQTQLNEVVVTAKKGKGVKDTTEIAGGKTMDEYLAKQKVDRASATAAYNTSQNRPPNSKVSTRERSDINDSVRESYAKTGVTKKGARFKDTMEPLSAKQQASYTRLKSK